MLLSFYLFSLAPVLFFLILSIATKQREIVHRSLTLVALLHLFCLILWQGPLAFSLLVAVIFILGVYELSGHYGINRAMILVPSLVTFALTYQYPETFLYVFPLPLLLLVVVCTFWGRPQWTSHPVFFVLFVFFLLLPCANFLIRLAEIYLGNIILILWLLQLNDAFGLLLGRKLGKTYLFPNISPKKSLEGYLSGGAGIVLGIWLLHTYIPVLPSWNHYQDLILFAVFFILGNTGDLLFSRLKRNLHIKDFGGLLPGHGGVLDRFDNILFVAPPFYVLVRLGILP